MESNDYENIELRAKINGRKFTFVDHENKGKTCVL